MKVALRLRYSTRPTRQPTAWFVPGDRPERWLEELAEWTDAPESLRLRVLTAFDPRVGEVRTLGVLVEPDRGASPQPPCGAIGYARLGARLYVPVAAEFDVPVDEGDLERLLPPGELSYVWHPGVGALEIPAEHVLRVADLLLAPAEREADWGAAIPGVALNARLLSISLVGMPSIEDLLEEGRDDIGSEPLELDKLPRSPAEPMFGPLMAGAAAAVALQAAKAARWLLARAGGPAAQGAASAGAGPSKPGVLSKVHEWTQRQLARMTAAVAAARHRELARLLSLLDTDPDEGLKFALPMGEGAHRGRATPGSRLMQNSVDFNLNSLGGGRPADFWDMQWDFRQRLIARYRELADREIQRGRHRRAAYILAHLLGDYGAAARALADGRHWREAAALYEDRLRNAREAARCLKAGGMWAEAVAILTRLGEFEEIGDLYRKLDRPEEAEQAYRQAVARHLEGENRTAAAELLERKLAAPEEALATLRAGWPESRQAARCVEESFRLLARQGWHARMRELIDWLCGVELFARSSELSLIERLADAGASYPEPAIREEIGDRVRTRASGLLRTATQQDVAAITAAVGRLAPDDRLLLRDAQRYADRVLRRPPKPPKVAFRPGGSVRVARSFRLPQAHWLTAVAAGPVFYAAGVRGNELRVVRGTWEGQVQEPTPGSWPAPTEVPGDDSVATSADVMLCADPSGGGSLFLHVIGQQATFAPRAFAPTDAAPRSVSVGSFGACTARTLAMQQSARGAVSTLQVESNLSLAISVYSIGNQSLLSTYGWGISDEDRRSLRIPPPFLMRDGWTYLGVGEALLARDGHGAFHRVECGAPVREIVASPPHTRTRVAVALDRGGQIHWGRADEPGQGFAADLSEPSICLNRGGWLIAVDAQELQVYSTQDVALRFHAGRPGAGERPLAVLPCQHADEFALCFADGRVQVYAIES